MAESTHFLVAHSDLYQIPSTALRGCSFRSKLNDTLDAFIVRVVCNCCNTEAKQRV